MTSESIWVVPAKGIRLFDAACKRTLKLSIELLMEHAGLAVAEHALSLLPAKKHAASRVVVLVGPGNNGGDGSVAARLLAGIDGCDVVCCCVQPVRAMSDLGALQLQRAKRAGARVAPLAMDTLGASDLVIDAMFGAGLSRPLMGRALRAVQMLGDANANVLSIDVPSGMNADTGNPLRDSDCVQAHSTLCLTALKPGMLTAQGQHLCGRITLATLPIPLRVQAELLRKAGGWPCEPQKRAVKQFNARNKQ